MKRHNIFFTFIVMAASLCLLLVMIIQLYPLIQEVINNVSDESKTVAYVQEYGARGIPILISLAALQYIIVIIPTPAVGVLIGLCYGAFWGPVIFLIGCALGNLFVFISVRQLHGMITPHLSHLIKHKTKKESKQDKLLSIEQLNKLQRPWLIVLFCFLIPGMPTTPITYLFARSKIPVYKFILATVTGSAPVAIVYAVLGNHLSEGNYTNAIIMTCIIIAIITGILIFRKRILNSILHQNQI